MESKLKALLQSRKFWAAVIGVALVVIKGLRGEDFPLSEDQLTLVVITLIGYITGTAIEDHGIATRQ